MEQIEMSGLSILALFNMTREERASFLSSLRWEMGRRQISEMEVRQRVADLRRLAADIESELDDKI